MALKGFLRLARDCGIAHDSHRWLRSLAIAAFTPAIDDYVAVDNPVPFIDAFVDGLNLKTAGFERVEAKVTGRPGYAPIIMAGKSVWSLSFP